MRPPLASFLEDAKAQQPTFHTVRVFSAFADVDALIELYREEIAASKKLNIRSEEVDRSHVEEWFRRSRRRDALHRAIIEATCIAFTVLLHEARGRPTDQITIVTMLAKTWSEVLTDKVAWRQLYALTIYRNKLVAHHEVARSIASIGEPDRETWRLWPSTPDLDMDPRLFADIHTVAHRAKLEEAPENAWSLLDFLFWNVPVTIGGTVSRERQDINKLAERGGVKSLSVGEIDELIDWGLSDRMHLLIKAEGH